MSVRHHFSPFDRGRAIEWFEIGKSITYAVRVMGVSKSVISRIKKSAGVGNAMGKHVGGRGSNTTPQKDRYVSLVAKRNCSVCKVCSYLARSQIHSSSEELLCRLFVALYVLQPLVKCFMLPYVVTIFRLTGFRLLSWIHNSVFPFYFAQAWHFGWFMSCWSLIYIVQITIVRTIIFCIPSMLVINFSSI